jgi:hypothetical protein
MTDLEQGRRVREPRTVETSDHHGTLRAFDSRGRSRGSAFAAASPQPTPCSASAPPSRSAWRCQGGRCSVGARVALEAWRRCVTTLGY